MYQTIRWMLVAAIATGTTTAALGATTPDPEKRAQAINTCSWFTLADIERMTGQKSLVTEAGDLTSLAGGAGSACTWVDLGAQIVLFTGAKSDELFENFLKNFKKDKEVRRAISGLGEGAYIMFPKPRNQYEDRVALVVVKKGSHTVGVSVSAPDGKTQESMEPAAVAFTKAVLAKIK